MSKRIIIVFVLLLTFVLLMSSFPAGALGAAAIDHTISVEGLINTKSASEYFCTPTNPIKINLSGTITADPGLKFEGISVAPYVGLTSGYFVSFVYSIPANAEKTTLDFKNLTVKFNEPDNKIPKYSEPRKHSLDPGYVATATWTGWSEGTWSGTPLKNLAKDSNGNTWTNGTPVNGKDVVLFDTGDNTAWTAAGGVFFRMKYAFSYQTVFGPPDPGKAQEAPMGGTTGRYIYVFIRLIKTQAAATAKATVTSTAVNDSGVNFSSMNGQVEYLPPGADPKNGWKLCKLNTALPIGSKIRTMEDSSAILSFTDMSIFILKPETTIVLEKPPEKESKLSLITGKIWANVKKIATTGEMEIDMNQVVLGIKGTTFVLEETGTQSIVKIIEGQVSVTTKVGAKTQLLNTGQTVVATSSGLTPVTSFNAAAEQKEWDVVKADTQAGKTASSSSLGSIPLLPVAIGVVVIILIVAVIVRSKKKKTA